MDLGEDPRKLQAKFHVMLGKFFRKAKPDEHFELSLPDVETNKYSEIAHPHPPNEPTTEIVVPPSKPPLLSAQNTALIAIILLLITGGLGIWSWMRYNNLDHLRQTESKQHESVIDSLVQVKFDLTSNLDQLQLAFTNLSADNDSLAEQLANATNIVAEKDTIIRSIKAQNIREESALRAQVQQLQAITNRYETIIAILGQKNAALTAENARLRGTSDSLSIQNSELGKKLEAQIRQTMSAQYKATGFRVELARRNDKPTIRAKRTRELNISFELLRVPATYQGNQQLYLVITDDSGVPISSKNPIKATVKTEKGSVAIIAQATQLQNVIENQRIALNYQVEDRLKKGTYIVSVYSEKGLLGVASFRLT